MNSHALPRILLGASERTLTLREHELTFAVDVDADAALEGELNASGLLGRGGASFSTAKKVELLRHQRGHHKVVVVNAMEGEPMGHKDRTLLSTNPHLLLDGAEYLASMIGAQHVDVCVSRNDPAIVHHVQRALHERDAARRRPVVRVAHAAVALRRRRGVGSRALAERQRDDAAVSTEATGRLARRTRSRTRRQRRDQRARRP